MRRARITFAHVLAAGGLVGLAGNARGVVVFDGEGRNLTPPTGSLLTPWNLQAHVFAPFVNYNATPISPSAMITAAHTGAGPGNTVTFAGNTYSVNGYADLAGSDLRILTIDTHGGTTTFPTFAPLWNPSVDGSEVGRPMAVFGRGMQRGAAVLAAISASPPLEHPGAQLPTTLTAATAGTSLSGPTPTRPGDLRGWFRGTDDRLPSWGENVVDDVVDISGEGYDYGDTLAFSFTVGSGRVANEAALSGGDSGGGLFIQSSSGWKLAGVNLSVDGNWSYSEDGPYAGATIFDARGLYVGVESDHQLVPYNSSPISASSYSSRIGSRFAAIQSIIGGSASSGGPILVPEPTTMAVLAAVFALSMRRRA